VERSGADKNKKEKNFWPERDGTALSYQKYKKYAESMTF
jgi:hypothetical protein